MANTLQVEVVTPQKVLLTAEAEYVTIPGVVGELGILPGHLPILTELKEGVFSYKKGSDVKTINILSGYAEVLKDKITVLAKVAE